MNFRNRNIKKGKLREKFSTQSLEQAMKTSMTLCFSDFVKIAAKVYN